MLGMCGGTSYYSTPTRDVCHKMCSRQQRDCVMPAGRLAYGVQTITGLQGTNESSQNLALASSTMITQRQKKLANPTTWWGAVHLSTNSIKFQAASSESPRNTVVPQRPLVSQKFWLDSP